MDRDYENLTDKEKILKHISGSLDVIAGHFEDQNIAFSLEDQKVLLAYLEKIENSLSIIAYYKKEFEQRKTVALEIIGNTLKELRDKP